MARFIATIQGQAGAASRLGSARSGIETHPRGWDIGVLVRGYDACGRDAFDIYATGGSHGNHPPRLLGTLTTDDDGHETFTPALA